MSQPARSHPLIESVLATNYEWGPLVSTLVSEALSKADEDEADASVGSDRLEDKQHLVIMPYPNFGNQARRPTRAPLCSWFL